MWTRMAITALVMLAAGGARADFSIVCDEQGQLEDILATSRTQGFEAATNKFRAYLRLRDERGEPTCEVTRVPDPASVGPVVGRYGALEFLPSELHDVLVVEIQAGARTLYGTINKFVSPKAEESGA